MSEMSEEANKAAKRGRKPCPAQFNSTANEVVLELLVEWAEEWDRVFCALRPEIWEEYEKNRACLLARPQSNGGADGATDSGLCRKAATGRGLIST